MSLEDFLAKVSWEGGVFDALEYGLSYTELDPSDTRSTEARAIWGHLEYLHTGMKDGIRAIEKIMEEMGIES